MIEKAIHINCDKSDIAPLVLMPGDPLRAKYIASKFLTNPVLVTKVRNMLGFTGYYKGKKVTIMGSGMGMPSMGIYSYELFHFYDVEKIIRIGTCGVLSENVNVPEIIVASAAYTESNFAHSYDGSDVSVQYPDDKLNESIVACAKKLEKSIHLGGVITSDTFGPYLKNDPIYPDRPNDIEFLAEEMEAFALFMVAKDLGRQASAIVTATDNKFTNKALTPEERELSLDSMIELALESIILE